MHTEILYKNLTAKSSPDIKSNLPGGSTGYIQPNYEKNREEIELMNLWEHQEESFWTVPKIIGVAAAGLCLLSLVAAGFQIYMTKKEKKVKRRIQRNRLENYDLRIVNSHLVTQIARFPPSIPTTSIGSGEKSKNESESNNMKNCSYETKRLARYFE